MAKMVAWVEEHARAPPQRQIIDGFMMGTFWDSCCRGVHKQLFQSALSSSAAIQAAFDQRFTAVVGSSPGAPIASPWRFTTSNFYGESPRTGHVVGPGTKQWWINATLQFDQHPENSPADGHMVAALIAPRACAIATGHVDDASTRGHVVALTCRRVDG